MASEPMPAACIRCRDLAAVLAVLLAGGSLIATLLAGGTDESVRVTLYAFAAACGLILVSYGGGAMVDRLGHRMPWLVRPHPSPRPLILFLPTIALLLLIAWIERIELASMLRQAAEELTTLISG